MKQHNKDYDAAPGIVLRAAIALPFIMACALVYGLAAYAIFFAVDNIGMTIDGWAAMAVVAAITPQSHNDEMREMEDANPHLRKYRRDGYGGAAPRPSVELLLIMAAIYFEELPKVWLASEADADEESVQEFARETAASKIGDETRIKANGDAIYRGEVIGRVYAKHGYPCKYWYYKTADGKEGGGYRKKDGGKKEATIMLAMRLLKEGFKTMERYANGIPQYPPLPPGARLVCYDHAAGGAVRCIRLKDGKRVEQAISGKKVVAEYDNYGQAQAFLSGGFDAAREAGKSYRCGQ